MASIEERIQKLGNYFNRMQTDTVEGKLVVYLVIDFPNGWIIDENAEGKYDISIIKSNNEPGEYFFLGEISKGFDVLFDAVDYCIEKMQDAIERTNLLKEKAEELRKIFEDETITVAQLRTLKFFYGTDIAAKLVAPVSKEETDNKKEKKSK